MHQTLDTVLFNCVAAMISVNSQLLPLTQLFINLMKGHVTIALVFNLNFKKTCPYDFLLIGLRIFFLVNLDREFCLFLYTRKYLT